MEEIIIYLLKSSGLIAAFFLSYHFLLRKETFFGTNRWFLLVGLITSVLLPLFFIKKIIFVKQEVVAIDAIIESTQDAVSAVPIVIETTTIDWFQIGLWIYGTVALFIILKVIYDIFSLYRILNNQKTNHHEGYRFVDIDEEVAPFSFFKYIVFNSKLYTEAELNSIITHEKIHSKHWHSVDVLVVKLFSIVFWFNPFIYWYKKAILQNLEYIADQNAIRILNNKKSYQMTLLKVVTHQNCLSITNQFNQSLIKKRVLMLNKNQSHQNNVWKYAVVFPALIAFVLLFQVKIVAQEVANTMEPTTSAVTSSYNYSSILTKDASDKDLKDLEKIFSNENHELLISNVKRNENGEIIEIKLTFDTKEKFDRILHRRSNAPIKNIKISVDTNNKNKTIVDFQEIDTEATDAVVVENSITDTNPANEYWSMDNMKKNGKDVVLIINGKIKGATEKVKMPLNEELGEMKELSPLEFEKKYHQKSDPNKYYFEASTVKKQATAVSYDEAVTKSTPKKLENTADKNMLLIINGKEYFQNDVKGYTFKCDGSITHYLEEEAVKRYGEKARDGVMIFNGTTKLEKTATLQETQKPKVVVFSNDNGDDIVITDNYKFFKVPGNPAVQLTNQSPVLVVNGKVQSNPKAAMENIDPTKIKSVRIYDENDKETKGTPIKKVVITTK